MEIVIETIMIVIFVGICCYIISNGINKQLQKELSKQRELNKQLINLFQNEQSKTDTLYKIIFHIRNQLSLLKLKDCQKEEFKNIPFEIIEWINLLEKESGRNKKDGVYK